MKLAISNIAWSKEQDQEMYKFLLNNAIENLEIAPTRIIEENPYDNLPGAIKITAKLNSKYGLKICSMQSIMYGRQEKIFGSIDEKQSITNYIKKAITFAQKINCGNLVFGSPKNRCTDENFDEQQAINFFKEIGDYAYNHNCVIAMEANPKIYGTNFINTTEEAISLIKKVDSKGFLLNLDIGTVIENNENTKFINDDNVKFINHVHISMPYLVNIDTDNDKIKEVLNKLKKVGYKKFVSIEISNKNVSMEEIKKDILNYKGMLENEK